MSGCFGGADARYGEGFSIGHAGEILQGMVRHQGCRSPFLVTLPAPPFSSRARIWESNDAVDVIEPAWKIKALEAARKAWRHLANRPGSFRLMIDSNTPVGRGGGSSTADCVAAIRAVADLFASSFQETQIAQWSAEAEGAVDSTMYDCRPVAFRQREGLLLRSLGVRFPTMSVIVIDLGGPPVDTVAQPIPDYTAQEIKAFQSLIEKLQISIERHDAVGVAQVATESAIIHHSRYPHPAWEAFASVAQRVGALGVGCAHSGSLAFALGSGDELSADRVAEEMRKRNFPIIARYALGAEESEATA